MRICEFSRELQQIMYACEYVHWYYKNEVYFNQFLSLKQGDLTVFKYEQQFSKLQYLCQLVESEEHDLNSFLRGLRLHIGEYD